LAKGDIEMRQKLQAYRFSMVILVSLLFLFWSCDREHEETSSETQAPAAERELTGNAGYRATAAQSGGTISGKVVFKKKHTPPIISVTKDQKVCGKSKKDPSLLVSKSGAVQNAVVYIADIHKGKKMEPQKVTLDQKDCEYHPHVLAFPAGSTVEIKNPDGILHNIHSYSERNDPFNLAQPKFKKTLTVTIEKPEVIHVKCDVHAWMDGWFFVAENQFFNVTDSAGTFKLTDVPPGTYTLELWHETLGKVSQKVAVKPEEEVKVTFELSKKQPGVT
jgi:plastocyanin